MFVGKPALLLASSIAIAAGCSSHSTAYCEVPDAPPAQADGSVPDGSVPSEARVIITHNGPHQAEFRTGQQDAEAFCFTVSATGGVRVRRLRFTIVDLSVADPVGGGLIDTSSAAGPRPNFTDITAIEPWSGIVVAGPVDVRTDGDDLMQPLILSGEFDLPGALSTKALCVRMDVAQNVGLDGDRVQIRLAPPKPGDVETQVGTDVPAENVLPTAVLVGQLITIDFRAP